MGSEPSQQDFIHEQWQLVEKAITHAMWRNRKQPQLHIEQHDKFVTDEYTYNIDREIFQYRHNNPFLVAGVFSMQNQLHQFCSTNYKYSQFIEAIPIRLSDIQHIPFPDILHVYYQCLHGFHLLAQKLDYFFQVEPSYIGINEKSVVKVWMSKYLANHSTIGNKISEERMVKGLIDILDKSSASFRVGSTIPTVRTFLYRSSDSLKFEEAKRQLQAYIKAYNYSNIPAKLECVERAGGVYFIANRPKIQLSNQPLTQGSYNSDFERSNPKIQPEHIKKSQIISSIGNNYQNKLSPNQKQFMPFAPLVSTPNMINFKKSQNFYQANQQKLLYLLPQPKQDILHNRSDNKNFSRFPPNSPQNNLKNSQSLRQERLIQPNQPQFSRTNIPIQNIKQIDSSLGSSTNEPQNGLRFDAQKRFSHARNVSEPSQQTKSNSKGETPAFSIQSHIPTNNSNFRPNLSNCPVNQQNSIRTQGPAHIKQKMLPTTFQHQISSSKSKQIPIGNTNSLNMIIQEPKYTKMETKSGVYNYPVVTKQNNINKEQQKLKEINLNLLAKEDIPYSFIASSSKSAAATELQKSFAKDQSPEVNRFQTKTYSSKNRNQLNPNPNDGKSSDQFLRQLRLVNQPFTNYQKSESFFAPSHSPSYSNLQIRNSNNFSRQNENKARDFYQESNKRSYKQFSNRAPVQNLVLIQSGEFGRNAVSNIIQNQESSYKNISSFANTQPFKFQQGLSLKYSILEPEQAQQNQFKKQSYVKYESPIDFRLMACLNAAKK